MNWSFWRKDPQHQILAEIKQLSSEIVIMKNDLIQVGTAAAAGLQQLEDFGGQLTKQTRIQYKSSQEIHTKLEYFSQSLVNLQSLQTECNTKESEVKSLIKQQDSLLNVLLQQLDELDTVFAGLNEDSMTEWRPLLTQWIQRIIASLAETGIYEMDLIGQSFDPQLAEGVGIISREPGVISNIPYEIVEIIKRGFANSEGILLRKAHVITYKESI